VVPYRLGEQRVPELTGDELWSLARELGVHVVGMIVREGRERAQRLELSQALEPAPHLLAVALPPPLEPKGPMHVPQSEEVDQGVHQAGLAQLEKGEDPSELSKVFRNFRRPQRF